MPPLRIEAYAQKGERWIDLPSLLPGVPPGSISNNLPDGKREVYLFKCAPDDSYSVLYRSIGGADKEIGEKRVLLTKGMKTIKTLRKGDEPYKLIIKTDASPQGRVIRFTHI